MSDSESAGEYGSAKDENFKASGDSAAESDSDAPLAKSKTTPKKSPKKSPKKKLKKEKPVPKKTGRGRPKKENKPIKDKTSKVRFSLDPLAGAEPEKDDDDEEEEYEVSWAILLENHMKLNLWCRFRSRQLLDTASTTESLFTRFAGRDTTQSTTLGNPMTLSHVPIFSKCTTQRWNWDLVESAIVIILVVTAQSQHSIAVQEAQGRAQQ